MAVTIRGKTLPLPILQGGMGVGISLDGLAGAVAACGGMGTLSTAVCGFQEPDFAKRPFEANLRALDRQVRRAKELARGVGLVAVNAMVAKIKEEVGPVDILVNNAGFGVFGEFTETALQEELELLQVNVRALHILTKLFLRDFKKRNFGRILNVASSAGFLTGPLFSSYYASKNYVVRLSLAIAEELRREKSRVTISILCPGPVDTGFNDRAGVQFRVKALTPEAVAKEAVFGLLTGKLLIIPGMMMRVGVAASKLVPEKLLSRILYHVQAAKQTGKK